MLYQVLLIILEVYQKPKLTYSKWFFEAGHEYLSIHTREKLWSKEKACKCFVRAVSACGLMRRIIQGKSYMCNWVLCNATWSWSSEYLRAYLLELKSKGLNLKFDQPSEVTFKDVSGKPPST